MSKIETVFIYDSRASQLVDAELHSSISQENIDDWKYKWQPLTKIAIERCRASRTLNLVPDSWHWNWERKTKSIEGLLAVKGFSIVCNGETQGLMQVITTAFGRHHEHAGKPIVYIDYLETAPWNIPEFVPPGRYKGVGSILIKAAINLSHDEEFKGRIGLHSVPKAEDFYLNCCGMSDLGIDAKKENLRYFEMTASQALEFAR